MSEIELKPCPFCGSKAKLMRVGAGRIVKCEGCGVSTSFMADDAAQAWNARAIDRDELLEVADECDRADVDGVTYWAKRIRKAVVE